MTSRKMLIGALCCTGLLVGSSLVAARPPGRPWGPPPPRFHHHHHGGHWAAGVAGGALAIGLGLGLAGAISNATTPHYYTLPPPMPVSPYVPPGYIAPSSVVITQPVPVPAAPSGKTMYWCAASKQFYPYVTECSSGWEIRIMP